LGRAALVARAVKTGSHVRFWSSRLNSLMVNPDTICLAKRVKLFNPNTTHLNNKLTRQDPFDLLYNKVYKNKNKNTNLNKKRKSYCLNNHIISQLKYEALSCFIVYLFWFNFKFENWEKKKKKKKELRYFFLSLSFLFKF